MCLRRQWPESIFIAVFAPWCPHCKAMSSAFIKVGKEMKGRMNVVEVDCEAHKAVCRDFGIRSFPTLRMYNEGEATEYRGGRSFEAMHSWALNAGSSSGVRQISSGDLEGVRNSNEVFFLYLHSPDTPEREIDAVTKASRVLLTTPVHVYRSSDSQLLSRYRTRLAKGVGGTAESYSGLLVFKDHEAEQPTSAFYPSGLSPNLSKESATADVAAWFDRERYPTVAELTGSTFGEIINNKQGAPVVLAALSDIHHSGRTQSTGSGSLLRDGELQDLRTLALAWRQRGGGVRGTAEEERKQRPEKVLFAWIDADRWATAIKKYYRIKAEQVPKLILADGARLEYYTLPSHFIDPFQAKKKPWIDEKEVFEALDLIWQGKGAKPKSSRSYLDRGVRSTTGAVEALGTTVAHHPMLSFLVASALFFAIFSSLRQKASLRPSHRLPLAYDKAD
jgi:thiol-disulfide isomerase/thioredoxin